MENPSGKRSLGRSQCRWKNNTKTDVNETDGMVLNGLLWLKSDLNIDGRMILKQT